MEINKTMSTKPYPITRTKVEKSPMKTIQTVKTVLSHYRQGLSIGFSRISSLKSMGILPRKDGLYYVSDKYK